MIFDSNIVFALMDEGADSHVMSLLEAGQVDGQVSINEIIFAEISPRFVDAALAMEVCQVFGLVVERLTLAECHRAGQAFAEYRRRGGERRSILSDFLIGAQAACRGWPLVTRDRKGFASYFPEVELIDPFTAEL